MVDTLFADVSYFQNPVDDTYPYEILSIRSNDGTFEDPEFAHNYQWCVAAADRGDLGCFIVYFYWRSNWADCVNVLERMVADQGGPHPKMIAMIDLESGGNPSGDQSDGVNRAYWALADWLGDPARVIGYANSGDFWSMWNLRPDGVRVIGAGYGADPGLPGEIAHQYTDGMGYGGGLPEGASPFGNCDMNSADGLSGVDFAEACGIGEVPIVNVIDEYAADPAHFWIGARLDPAEESVEHTCPDGVGKWVAFEDAHVYWTPTTGAHAIPHADPDIRNTGLFETWGDDYQWETGPLGYPLLDFTKLDGGANQAFQGGVLFRKDGQRQGFYVHGAIGSHYAALGYETSELGYPTGNEYPVPGDIEGYLRQDFEHGTLTYTPDGVVAELSSGAPITRRDPRLPRSGPRDRWMPRHRRPRADSDDGGKHERHRFFGRGK